jgi:hypothetical protein
LDADRIHRDPLAESASAGATALGCCDSGRAQHWAPLMNEVSGVELLLLLVTGLGLKASNIISLIGSDGFRRVAADLDTDHALVGRRSEAAA